MAAQVDVAVTLEKEGSAALTFIKEAEAVTWVTAQDHLSRTTSRASEYVFALAKEYATHCSLPRLLTVNFDAEQIWQQIDLQAAPLLAAAKRQLRHLHKDQSLLLLDGFDDVGNGPLTQEFTEGDSEDAKEPNNAIDDLENDVEEDEDTPLSGDVQSEPEEDGKKYAVEDKFLKLKDMERFLDDAEAPQDLASPFHLDSDASEEDGSEDEESDEGDDDIMEPPPRKVSRTIENTREVDETIAQPDDEELHAEDAADEFSAHFNHEITPQLLITSSRWCSTTTIKFIAELLRVLPNAHYYKRGSYEIKQIVKYAKNRDFTAIVVVHDNRKEPNGMLVISLPNGPTAHFKISNLVLSKKIKGHGKPTSHLPELILNNFTTRIGHRVGRMLASLFPQQPNFRGRRVVTFHNQRDFIFFRHHRYIFEEKEVKDATAKGKSKLKGASKESGTNGKRPHKDLVIAHLQECGPRFTLKLLSLQHGTFDSKFGEYEWLHKADMDTSRRRFFM